MIAEWIRRVRYVLNRARHDDELRAEMDAHRAMMDNPARFGSTLRLREQAADVWGVRWLDAAMQDAAFAVRGLRRNPGFAAAGPVVLGLLFGLVGATLAGAAIRATLYGVPPLAPIVFVAVSALLGSAGTLACYLPARRAGQVDPAITLRWE